MTPLFLRGHSPRRQGHNSQRHALSRKASNPTVFPDKRKKGQLIADPSAFRAEWICPPAPGSPPSRPALLRTTLSCPPTTRLQIHIICPRNKMGAGFSQLPFVSGRVDLNHRPLGPEPSALAPALLPDLKNLVQYMVFDFQCQQDRCIKWIRFTLTIFSI